MSVQEKKYITLEEVLKNDASYDVYIKTLDVWVKIRNATSFDRIEAEKLAHLHPSWDKMTQQERDYETGKMMALVILVQPKISYEDYKKSDDITMQILLTTISNEYSIKLAKLADQHGANMRAFLLATLGKDLVTSLTSLESTTSTSKEQPSSGEI